MFDKYIDVIDYTTLRIPKEIIIKTLSLHPINIDYLIITSATKDQLDKDLTLLSKILKEEESYGLRNLHDRIHFLFTNSTFLITFSK